MSRLFDDAFNEYLQVASAVVTEAPHAMVAWFNSDDATIEQSLITVVDESSALSGDFFNLRACGTVAGDPIRATVYKTGQPSEWAESTSGYSVDTWHHAAAIFTNKTDRRAYIDGGSKGTDAVDRRPDPADISHTQIGMMKRAANIYYPMSGRIAEAAIYVLTDYPGATLPDKADHFETQVLPALAAGYCPLFFPLGLVAYWPLVRDQDYDPVGGYDMTAFNTPTVGPHPGIMYPAVPLLGREGDGGNGPVVSPAPNFLHVGNPRGVQRVRVRDLL